MFAGSKGLVVFANPDVVVKDSSVIESASILSGASVGPFAHLRPGSDVGRDASLATRVPAC